MPVAWFGIAFYAVLVGASAGVVRAAIMGSLAIFALRIGRPTSGLNTLIFVAALMALHDPHVLWDVGFQLSFMATLGLMLYAEPLSAGYNRIIHRMTSSQSAKSLAGSVGSILLFTIAAQLTTLPLILYYFHQLPMLSLLANLLVLPVQPALMVLGGLSTIAGLVFLPLGKLMAFFAWPLIAYTIRVVELLAEVPDTAIAVDSISKNLIIGFYSFLFGLTLVWSRLRTMTAGVLGGRGPLLGWSMNLGLALLTLMVWQQVLALPDGRLHLTMLDVGNGDALLIQTPVGRTVLVGGGSSSNAISAAVGKRLPTGRRGIDFLVVGCADEEHIAALPGILSRVEVKKVLWAGPEDASHSAHELQKAIVSRQTPLIRAQPGQLLELGEGARLEVLSVTRRGMVLLLAWDRFRVLLPVGLDFDSLETLLKDRRQGPVFALMLAEGGHAKLNSAEWIARWKPQLALLSVTGGNPDGLPHPETLSSLEGVQLLRTDRDGWIKLSTDGKQMWVEVER